MRLDFGQERCNLWLLGMLAGALLAGCGGGGSGGAEVPATLSYPTGTVSVTATDSFGEPVSGASVSVYKDGVSSPSRRTGQDGRVDIPRVPLGTVSVTASHDASAGGPLYGTEQTTVQEGQRVAVSLTLAPSPYLPLVGIGGSTVAAEGDPDARTLEFTLPVFLVNYDAEWEWTGLTFEPCTPDPANDDESELGDCVVGAAGFDAEYTAANDGHPLEAPLSSESPSTPLRHVTLLLDQSADMARHDPFDWRLYGARYAASHIGDGRGIAVAAFAADDPSGTELTTLERAPLTIYPTNTPRFLPPSDALSETIDALSEREGGIAPLYAAVSEALDFVATRVPEGERRAAVLLTDGQDDTCGDATACAAARQAVVEKTVASGVELVSVVDLLTNDPNASGPSDIALLAEETNGAAFWVTDRSQLGVAFHTALAMQNFGGARLARFRLESPIAGAFASGQIVHGAVTYAFCPWDCSWITVPVAIRIP